MSKVKIKHSCGHERAWEIIKPKSPGGAERIALIASSICNICYWDEAEKIAQVEFTKARQAVSLATNRLRYAKERKMQVRYDRHRCQ